MRRSTTKALQLAASVECWIDEAAAVWLTAADVLLEGGRAGEARAAADAGSAWVRRGAVQWQNEADSEAWLRGNPVHRRLLEWQPRKAGVVIIGATHISEQ